MVSNSKIILTVQGSHKKKIRKIQRKTFKNGVATKMLKYHPNIVENFQDSVVRSKLSSWVGHSCQKDQSTPELNCGRFS